MIADIAFLSFGAMKYFPDLSSPSADGMNLVHEFFDAVKHNGVLEFAVLLEGGADDTAVCHFQDIFDRVDTAACVGKDRCLRNGILDLIQNSHIRA